MATQSTGRLGAVFGVTLLCGVAIATDYQIKTPKVQPVESYAARATAGSVTIAVEPYDTDEKSYTVFDVRDLNSRGYFPLQAIIQNGSQDYLTLRTRDIVLVSATGQQLYTTPATLVVQDVVKGGLQDKIPKLGRKDKATSTRTGSPLIDFTSKELTNRGIDPGAVISGFLFFYTPEPKKNPFRGSTLRIPQIGNDSTRQSIGPFSIRLDPALAAAHPR